MNLTLLTIGFNNIETMARTFGIIKTLKSCEEWLVLDNCYSKKSSHWLNENANLFGYKLLERGYNMGLHRGYNFLIDNIKTDYVCCVDPDTFPMTMAFDAELMKHTKDKRNVWISAYNTHSFSEMRNPILEGELIIPQHPVVNSIVLWSTEWLKKIGGIQEPTDLYGGLECYMWRFLDQKDTRWVFALNVLEACSNAFIDYQDKIYRDFKWAHAHMGDKRSWEQFKKENK